VTRRGGPSAATLLRALALGAVALLTGCGEDGPPPSLVLITLDTTRADRLGCYGYDAAHTPTLDSLAAEGTRFDRAMAAVPVTLPSHSTILTGVGPARHGVRDNGVFILGDEFETVAETLGETGYQTGAFLSAFVLSRPYGTAQGFTTYDDHLYNERPGHLTTRKAVGWLERIDPSQPFFLWVHYYDPHLPRTPVEPFRSMDTLDPYDQEVAAMDAAIGQLLGEMRGLGMLDRTDVLVVGDHGEGLGDHGEPEHGMFLYDTTMRVPFLLVRHDATDAERGLVVSTLVSTSDVQPTLLDLAGVDGPEVEGESVLSFSGSGDGVNRDRWAYGETYFTQFNFYHSHLFSYTSARWKYVDGPRPELYDLAADPHETVDLVAELPDTAAAIKARLDRFRDRWGGDANPNPLTTEEIERLQSLGYLGGGDVAVSVESSEEFFLPDPKELRAFATEFAEGLHLINLGRAEEAAELLETVIVHNPENLIARLNLGRIYTGLDQTDAAIMHLREATHLAPDNATCKKYLGIAFQRAGRYEEAIEVLRGIRSHPSQGISASKEIARCQLLMGRAEEAQHTLRFLADSGGGGPEIARLAERIGVLIDARAALTRTPGDERARLAVAGAALDVQLLAEARQALDFTASTAWLEATRRRLRGSVAGAAGDYDLAREEFEAVLPTFPDDPYVRMQLTALYLDANQPERSLELAEGLIREGGSHPVAYYNKACALAQLGQVDAALDALRRAVRRGYVDYRNLQEDPDLDPLRDEVRFTEILALIGQPS
jgi:arylsulfatase A-like enzyme/Flp pilus assembly protein TadD